MLTNIEEKILIMMLDFQQKYITGAQLAEYLKVSDRTVRKYINLLNEKLESIAFIESKKSMGYRLIINAQDLFHSFVSKHIEYPRDLVEPNLLETETDRQKYLLNKLLIEERLINHEELMDILYISESYLNKLFKSIRNLMKDYQLELIRDTHSNYSVRGLELNKRRFILDYFFSNRFEPSFLDNLLPLNLDHENMISELTIIVLDETREPKLKVNDFMIQNLVLHLYLAIQRIKLGFQITTDSKIQQSQSNIKTTIAEKIVKRIESLYEVEFPEIEIHFIALHLTINPEEALLQFEDSTQLKCEILETLKRISLKVNIPLENDSTLINGLLNHFPPLLDRLSNNIKLRNPLLNEVKQEYDNYLRLTETYFSQMALLKNFQLSEDEWAYITLHIIASIEKQMVKSRLKVIVVCASGYGSAQILKVRLQNALGNMINIIDVLSYYELSNSKFQDADFIISSINLGDIILPIPFVKVSVFLDNQEVEKVKTIAKSIIGTRNHQFSKQSELEHELNITNLVNQYFDEDNFLITDKSLVKEEALDILIEKLARGNLQLAELLKNEVMLREQLGTLIFSDKLAIPHPAKPVALEGKIAVLICPNGIKWDNQKVDIEIVLFVSPSKINNPGLSRITQGLAYLIDHPENLNQLIESHNFNDFKNKILHIMQQEENL